MPTTGQHLTTKVAQVLNQDCRVLRQPAVGHLAQHHEEYSHLHPQNAK